jgi:hypothetical protein
MVELSEWLRIGPLTNFIPACINPVTDKCFYMREYYPGKGFLFSETNQLIKNYKYNIANRPDLESYKVFSINKFALELSSFFTGMQEFHLSFIPTSKCKTDGNYDDRFESTLIRLKELNNNIIIEEPVILDKSIRASHLGGPRFMGGKNRNYRWLGLGGNPEESSSLYIIDDVITTGTHFKAFKNMIKSHYPQLEVIGLFWAMTASRQRHPQ